MSLKQFLQEAIKELKLPEIHDLSETLRIDNRDCENRKDLEDILINLLCLDQQTSLAAFLTWLQNERISKQPEDIKLIGNPTDITFQTTFLPLLLSKKSKSPSIKSRSINTQDVILSNHLMAQLDLLHLLESKLKVAERNIHTGTPSFTKVKEFLQLITQLRNQELLVRSELKSENDKLHKECNKLKADLRDARDQLEFFMDGFVHLRRRHDVLLERTIQWKAEQETMTNFSLSIAAHDSYLRHCAIHTLEQQHNINTQLKKSLEDITTKANAYQGKLAEALNELHKYKKLHLTSRKAIYCYKLQCRRHKSQVQMFKPLQQEIAIIERDYTALSIAVNNLLAIFMTYIQQDVKSKDKVLSFEILQALQKSFSCETGIPEIRQLVDMHNYTNKFLCRDLCTHHLGEDIFQSMQISGADIDDVVRGIILIGGSIDEVAQCAHELSCIYAYLPVDMLSAIEELNTKFQPDQNSGEYIVATGNNLETLTDDITSDSVSILSQNGDDEAREDSPQYESQSTTCSDPHDPYISFVSWLALRMNNRYVSLPRNSVHGVVRPYKGYILYNCEFSRQDINRLVGAGLQVDSIIDLPGQNSKAASYFSLNAQITASSTCIQLKDINSAQVPRANDHQQSQSNSEPDKSAEFLGFLPYVYQRIQSTSYIMDNQDEKLVGIRLAADDCALQMSNAQVNMQARVKQVIDILEKQKAWKLQPKKHRYSPSQPNQEKLKMFAEDVKELITRNQEQQLLAETLELEKAQRVQNQKRTSAKGKGTVTKRSPAKGSSPGKDSSTTSKLKVNARSPNTRSKVSQQSGKSSRSLSPVSRITRK